jgi:FKBP-type peptidyl-prolyl cis-trans isomerase
VSDEPAGSGLDATLRDFSRGQKVFNRYTLIRTLGRGGMGIVWLAHDEVLDRDVALKFLPEIIIHDRAVLEDLKRETKRSLELTHKNIVRIHDFVHDIVSGCISMEYIEGDTLSNLRADKPAKIFEPEEIKPWLSQLCDALDYAHNHARIIHRDLKPSNLMISKRGHLKVADFGIARSLSDSVSMLTHARGTSGTLVYMSPQQLDGERGTHLDDIYSLGATIYELLTSRPPFYSGNIDRQIREKTAPPMMQRRRDLEIEGQQIPGNWEETVASCLAKDPSGRPQSVADVANRLQLMSSRTSAMAERTLERSKKKPFLILAAAAAIGIAVLASFWFGSYESQRKLHRPEASPASSEQIQSQPAAGPRQIPTVQPTTMATQTPAVAETETPSAQPTSDKDKVSYSIGLNIGFNIKQQKLEINAEALAAGVRDATSGKKPLLTENEVRDVLTAWNKQVSSKQKPEGETKKELERFAGSGPLKDLKDKASYSLGLNIGFTFKKQNLGLNIDMSIGGIKDAIVGMPRMTEAETKETMMAFEKDMQTKQEAAGQKNKAEGEKFLAENKTKDGVKTTASGLQYKILKEGTGAQPKANDTVTVNYRGTLIDGTEFDSSYKRGQPASFPVGGVIKGWTEALQLMKTGSKYQLFIPANLAYGERGAGRDIAPNSTLIFEVELLDVKPPAGGAAPSGSPAASPR